MGAFKNDIFTSNLHLIDFPFIMTSRYLCPFFGYFLAESPYPKICIVKDQTPNTCPHLTLIPEPMQHSS